MKITAEKIKKGDKVRVIAPSLSMEILSAENIADAVKALELLGLQVSFGDHVNECDLMSSSSITSRLEDLHTAFADKSVKAIFSVIGGFNANHLLPYIDYDLIQKNPKIFCGYSDITVLQNAILSKTGLITYSGPHFSTFAMAKGLEYTIEYFQKILFTEEQILLTPSHQWSDDAWFLDQHNRVFHHNDGYWVLHEGKASGIIIGGNLSTMQLLLGTNYRPSFENAILFLESDSISGGMDVAEFDRQLQSILHQPDFCKVKALIIGRFETKFSMSREKLEFIISSKMELASMPVIANVDFGHTNPMVTLPIGGKCTIEAEGGKISITLSG